MTRIVKPLDIVIAKSSRTPSARARDIDDSSTWTGASSRRRQLGPDKPHSFPEAHLKAGGTPREQWRTNIAASHALYQKVNPKARFDRVVSFAVKADL